MNRACLILLLAPALALAQGTAADYERAARLRFHTQNKVFRQRVEPNWFAGGERFWYRNDLANGAREWVLVDARASKRELAFDQKKLAEALSKATGKEVLATHLPLERLSFTEEGNSAHFRALGRAWSWDRSKQVLTETEPRQKEVETSLLQRRTRGRWNPNSPDGQRSIRVKDHNLYLVDRKTGREMPLTKDGSAKDGYGDEMFWSPDSKKLVALRVRRVEMRKVHLIESSPRDQLQPRLITLDYAKPGDAITIRKPRLFDVETGKDIPIRDELFSTPWSIDRLRWDRDSKRFTFVYNQRGHQVLRVIAVDAATGQARAIVDETSKTFIDYAHKQYLHWLSDEELLWMSERDGWNHLYLIDARAGTVKRQLTRGEWVVRRVERVDEKARQVWFTAGGIYPGQDPYHIHHARIDFTGKDLVLLTEGDGTHEVSYSPDRKYLIDTWSRIDLPPVTELRRGSDGKRVCKLEEADARALLATGWRMPERFVAKGRDGKTDIHGVIFRPTNFDAKKKYPVIERIYAGPQGSFTPRAFQSFHPHQAMAELGFIVVQMDGMGTSHRSKAFHDVCWKNLGDSGFPDRIPWMRAAARKYPEMDLTRVGIYGGSAGGQSALRALLAHGDFYKVAVADCGCHDNRVDKIWWNELWMGWPIGPHYAEQSNVTNAHRLRGKLLLIVGEVDRNVDPACTLQVVNALIKANRDFDLLFIPGAGHGAAGTPYGRRRQQDFFVRHLLGVEPRQ